MNEESAASSPSVKPRRPVFRFMGLEVWREAIEVADLLFDLADRLETKRLFRFAEQARGVGMSMTNNIAEGSGSVSNREFFQFLNISRRSTFEGANMCIVLERRGLLNEEETTLLLNRLDRICRMITNFRKRSAPHRSLPPMLDALSPMPLFASHGHPDVSQQGVRR